MTLVDAVKSIFFGFLILIIAPLAWQELTYQYTNFFDIRAQVGVIPIQGIIADSSCYIQQLQIFFANPDIKAILLTFDDPQPISGSAETIYTQIQALKRQYPKPVIGFIENICIANGYWIACAADYLIAPGSSLIGAIGTLLPSTTSYQACVNIMDEAQQKELLPPIRQDLYQQSIHMVAQARKVSLAKTDQWADSKIFTGQQAYKLHLIDEIGSWQRVITILKQKALIEGDIKWIYRH